MIIKFTVNCLNDQVPKSVDEAGLWNNDSEIMKELGGHADMASSIILERLWHKFKEECSKPGHREETYPNERDKIKLIIREVKRISLGNE